MTSSALAFVDIDGLPAGYTGRLYVASPGMAGCMVDGIDEIIDPGTLHFGSDRETLWGFVWPVDEPLAVCGYFTFGVLDGHIMAETTDVCPPHGGNGISTAVYQFVQHFAEIEVRPSNTLSLEGKRMWKNLKPILEADRAHWKNRS